MNAKHLILFFLCSVQALFSQSMRDGEYEFLWPMGDSGRGENIIMYPTDQIYNRWRDIEENFGHYLIGGRKHSPILALSDGIIVDCGYSYMPEFLSSWSDDDYQELYTLIHEKYPEEEKWINYSIGLKTTPGKIIYYNGLTAPAKKIWKTGEIVKKGEILGTLGYSIRSIDQPALDISLSVNGKRGDLGPGLLGVDNHLFQDNQESKNMKSYQHPADELKEALRIMKLSLEEGHPALYEYSSREEIDTAFAAAEQQITKPMTSDQFYKVLMPIISAVRDNHIYLVRSYLNSGEDHYSPRLSFPLQTAYLNDKLYILKDPTGQTEPGQEITSINGKELRLIAEELKILSGSSDGFSEGWENINLNYRFGDLYLLSEEIKEGEILKISLSNGKQITYMINKDTPDLTSRPKRTDANYQLSRIDNNILVMKLYGMSLRETEKEEISDFFKHEINTDDKVILDLRSNPGGEIEGTYFIFSLFARTRFTTGIYNRVNRRSAYPFFRYTNNFNQEISPYPEYHRVKGKEGFYLYPTDSPNKTTGIEPVDNPFNGEVYVLTNGGTGSAAVELSALFKHYHRGIIIGAEGACAYHKMNGLDFAKVRLGNTEIVLNIPLVHTVLFPDNDNINPAGRGVIPDYQINSGIDDLLTGNDSAINFIINNF